MWGLQNRNQGGQAGLLFHAHIKEQPGHHIRWGRHDPSGTVITILASENKLTPVVQIVTYKDNSLEGRTLDADRIPDGYRTAIEGQRLLDSRFDLLDEGIVVIVAALSSGFYLSDQRETLTVRRSALNTTT